MATLRGCTGGHEIRSLRGRMGVGSTYFPLHFMTTMLAAVLAWNPLFVYNPGFQLSVAAVFGILLLRKPLLSLVKSTVLRPIRSRLHSS